VVTDEPDRVRELGARLDVLRARFERASADSARRPLDALTSDALRALGYLDP
jgi:hypothetical protein